jgi:hypothetical protein
MALTDEQRQRVAWLLEGYLDDDEATFERRWAEQFAVLSSPEELFLFAAHSNASQSPAEWRRVLDSPLCDMGTALLVFWRNSPVWHYEFDRREDVPEFSRESYDLVREIEARYRAGGYPSRVVRFDPADYRGRSFLDGYEAGEVERVPEEMRRPSPGEAVVPLW